MSTKDKSPAAQALRSQAEAIVRETGFGGQREAISLEAMHQALHELRVHQIELEMQNEELRRIDVARERYCELYDMAPVGYCTLSEKEIILEANLTAATLLGVVRESLLKQPLSRFIFKDDQVIYYFHRKRLLEVAEPQACELRMVKRDGATFWARMEATIGSNESGKPVFRVMLSDISDRKQAEGRLQLAACVFSHAREGIMITTADGTIVDVNRAFTRITGYSRREALGRNSRFHASDRQDQAFYAAMRHDLIDDGYWSGEVWNRRKNGEVYVEMQTISTVPDVQGNIRQIVTLFSDITATKQAEEALAASEELRRLFIEYAPAGLAMFDRDMRYLYTSDHWFADHGLDKRDLHGLSHYDVFPEIPEQWKEFHRRGLAGEVLRSEGDRFERLDGSVKWMRWEIRPWYNGQGSIGGIIIFTEDITANKKAEEALREQEESFRLIAENLDGFVVTLDADGRRVYNSPSYARLLGERQIAGSSSFDDIHPADRERVMRAFREAVATGIGQHLEYRFLMANGSTCLLESRSGIVRDDEGRTKRVVVVSHDITERRRAEEKIQHLAFHDALTQLPNRSTLHDRLIHSMAASKRSGCYGALMFLDLDHFKPLNDRHGHDAGDLLLIDAAARLKRCVRETDTVARFGGDEFAVLLSELHADKDEATVQARRIAEKIRLSLSEPYRMIVKRSGMADHTVDHHCTVSIGVSLFIDDEVSPDKLVKRADAAMYQAKEDGRNRIRF